MIFGLAGASGVGKTTLAIAVAKEMKIHYFDASVSAMAKELGYDPVSDMTPGERITMQFAIFDKFLDRVNNAPRPMISDRTPLDFIAYMLGEVTMHNTDPKLSARIDEYVGQCLAAADTFFDTIIIVRPLPTYQVAPNRPPLNRAYQAHIQYIIEGTMETIDIPNSLTLMTPDLDERVDSCVDELTERLDEIGKEHAQAMASGKLH